MPKIILVWSLNCAVIKYSNSDATFSNIAKLTRNQTFILWNVKKWPAPIFKTLSTAHTIIPTWGARKRGKSYLVDAITHAERPASQEKSWNKCHTLQPRRWKTRIRRLDAFPNPLKGSKRSRSASERAEHCCPRLPRWMLGAVVS